jgi:hypothetical protein
MPPPRFAPSSVGATHRPVRVIEASDLGVRLYVVSRPEFRHRICQRQALDDFRFVRLPPGAEHRGAVDCHQIDDTGWRH